MNEFTYHNIFETKGIEYLITIAFFLLLIPFWMLLNRKIRVREAVLEVKSLFSSVLANIPKGLFVSPTHTWAFMERTGNARVGLDNLLVHLTGNANLNFVKKEGEWVEKGELITIMEREGKQLNIYSPISGSVIAVNAELIRNSELIKSDPYGKGWIFEIEPQNWIGETSTFYLADKALAWLHDEFGRFREFLILSSQKYLTPAEQLVLQDGGELVDNTLADLPAEVWNEFQQEFLNMK